MSESWNPEAWHARFRQQAGWTRDIRFYLYQRAEVAHANRILEVGCGTGALLDELRATARPDAQIIGLDRKRDFLQLALRNSAAPVAAGDACRLPFARYSFDVSCCHFLLLWLEHPVQTLWEMKRVTRPGGAILALAEPDYGGRVDYPEALACLGKWQAESLRLQGADPWFGRKLMGAFQAAGLSEVESGVLGGQWKASAATEDADLEWDVLTADLNHLSEEISSSERANLEAIDRAARRRGERILFVPTFWAWGRVAQDPRG